MAILAAWGWTSLALAYTPTNWLPEHAASDFQKAEAIVVARVVGLNRAMAKDPPDGTVKFHATLVVGRSYRGPLKRSDRFTFLIGEDWVGNPPEEDRPRFGLLIFGTHMSYWLEINGVYLLCLARTERGWEPRSGPQSVFRIQEQSPSHEEVPLVVDPRGNRAEAVSNVIREVRDKARILLDDFVRQKMETRPPKQPSEAPR
jgi:hypothetical protein